MNPSVFLIGAGPGDPELLTLKGLRCLQVANCVVYDSLVNIDLLQYVRADAEVPFDEIILKTFRKGRFLA